MIRLRAGGPNRYYLCPECGAVREDLYRGGASWAPLARRAGWYASGGCEGSGAGDPEGVRRGATAAAVKTQERGRKLVLSATNLSNEI